MRIEYAGQTDVGRSRDHNEDAYLLAPESDLFIVADGLGGHAAGEVASAMAVKEIAGFFQATDADGELTWPFKMDRSQSYDENRLGTAIKLANSKIHAHSLSDPNCKRMGSTIVSVYFRKGKAIFGHVGDSRAYLWRGGEFSQVTEDHSLLAQFIRQGNMTPEEIENFPHKNVILRALGQNDSVEVELQSHDIQSGDIYLLCSDGLSGMITDAHIAQIMESFGDDIEGATRELVDAANMAGGKDNVTVVLARVAEL